MTKQFPSMTFEGLTGGGSGITWEANGQVSKSPILQNGAYAGLDCTRLGNPQGFRKAADLPLPGSFAARL